MNQLWINNPLDDRAYILNKTEEQHPSISQQVIEKDWWVTAVLNALFKTECKEFLSFKGGTSLSKGWGLIERFSEDIDLAIGHHFFGIDKTSKNQREKLRKLGRKYIHQVLSQQVDNELKNMGITGYSIENVTQTVTKEGTPVPIDSDQDPTVILVHYESIIPRQINYVSPSVKIEISCLSMDEPVEDRAITSLIHDSFPDEDADTMCRVKTVVPTRTFLEKIFLLSEEFQKDNPRSLRMSRHLYDIERIMDSEFGTAALATPDLYRAIVEHRRQYYALKYVDYDLHAPSTINIMPPERVLDDWRRDYRNMQASFIYGGSKSFDELLARILELQGRLRIM